MSFAAYFPYLVNSIILLGPGGILRSKPNIYDSVFFRFPWLFPSLYVRELVGRYLGVYLKSLPYDQSLTADAITGRIDGETESARETSSKVVPPLDVSAIVRWQFENHQGFIHGFLSTTQHGPITNQHADWAKVGASLRDDVRATLQKPNRLKNQKLLVILGDTDDIVRADEMSHDLSDLFGSSKHVEIKIVSGGHGFPVPCSRELVEHIWQFWDL